MGSGETALRGAEGERRSSQAKGPVPDDTPKRPGGDTRPPKVQLFPWGKGNLSGNSTGAQSWLNSSFVPFFAA